MLHHLGVDMGTFPITPGIRGYATYEDTGMDRFKSSSLDPPPPPVVITQRFHLPQYVEFRRLAKNAKRFGSKMSAAYWVGYDPDSLEVDVVLVNRPLEDSIISDRNIYLNRHKDASLEDLGWQAAGVAWCWQMKNLLRELIAPVLELDYYGVLDQPMDACIDIASTLGLHPTREQELAACRFADPELRHI